ncbi:MAG: response regulator [Candidatus Tenebribacter davisii]|nr:response regulator [Candidatus Tenebribacter davisii]
MDKKLKVLVVEDEMFTAKNLCKELLDLDVEALKPVATGEEAVEVALKEIPDLILMDIKLADKMDGIEAARKIKERSGIPIVFMTGYATEYIQEQAQEVNCLEFFEKPISIKDLKPLIHELKLALGLHIT